jgi:MoaA/NifB/PqqE/SkfB family radical SAM enzyme
MSKTLFSRIIDQAKEYGIKEIMPFLNGEPLLDKSFVAKIQEINDKIPDAHVTFYSNGSLLTKEQSVALSTVKLAAVNFSINSITDAGRQTTMHLPLQQTVDNILEFQKQNPHVAIGCSALMDTTYMTPEELQEFVRFWMEKKVRPNMFFNGNWAGKTRKVCNVEGGCSRPGTILTVLSDGNTALCCYDLNGEVSFGNLKDKTIADVWESEELENYRFLNDAGRRKELKLCKDCTTG